MPDVLSKQQRSKLMSLVRSRNTQFELTFLRLLSAEIYPQGFRYRKHHRATFGTPDIVFLKFKLAVFLDSDFWHGRNYDQLASRMNSFWRQKIERNMERDREVNRRLRREGWAVLRFGEKNVKRSPASAVRRIGRALLQAKEKSVSSTGLVSGRPSRMLPEYGSPGHTRSRFIDGP